MFLAHSTGVDYDEIIAIVVGLIIVVILFMRSGKTEGHEHDPESEEDLPPLIEEDYEEEIEEMT